MTIKGVNDLLAQKTRVNTELIEQKTSHAQELDLLAKGKERSKEMLQKVKEAFFTTRKSHSVI